MITMQYVGDHAFAEPSRPSRIKLASGQSSEIRDPERIMVDLTSVSIPFATGPDRDRPWHELPLSLLETIEPLDAPVHQANG